MRQTSYNCTTAELYAVARTGWNSYTEHLTSFSAMRGFYDAVYGDTANTEIDNAELLPDDQARYAQVEVLRTELSELADQCLSQWQLLKRYISTSFPEATLKARLEEAGALKYEKAANYNWEVLKQLNISATGFITLHIAALTAGNNMPNTFETQYSTRTASYQAKMQQFLDEEELAVQATDKKVEANNNIHSKLMSMFRDGQEIFKKEEPVKRQFVFDTVLSIVSGPGIAGIRGIVTNSVTALPLGGVLVTVSNTPISVATSIDGKYKLTPLASGIYKVLITATGFQDKIIPDHKIPVGTITTLDIALDPL